MKKILLPLVLALFLVLTACGGSSAPTTAPVTQTEAPTVATEASASLPFPTGKFVRSDRVNPVGFIFNADGTWEAKEFTYGMTQAQGTYSADDDTFTELSNDEACPPMDFNYTFDGKNLTFTYVGNPEDDKNCDGRYASFNNVTYTLADASESNFPTGKFIKEGSTQYGLQFNEDGTFQVFNGNMVLVNATYTADDSIFTETSNTGGCETNVSFNYTFDGKNLTFTYVGNPDDDTNCDGRRADFNNMTYTLVEE